MSMIPYKNLETIDKFPTSSLTQDGFFQVPNWIANSTEVSATAKLVYGRLIQYAGDKNRAFPKHETLASEIGKSKDTIRRALRELKALKLVDWRKEWVCGSNVYYFQEPDKNSLKPAEKPMCAKMHTPMCAKMHTPITNRTNLKDKTNSELRSQQEQGKEKSMTGVTDIEKIIEEAKQKNKKAQERKLLRASNKQHLKASDVELIWIKAFRETYEGYHVTTWSGKLKGIMNKKSKGFTAKELADVVDWSVRNWEFIIAEHFSWMTKKAPPEMPDIGFFLGFINKFVDAYAEKDRRESINALPREERFVVNLIRKGVPEKEARAIAEKKYGNVSVTEKYKQELAKVRTELSDSRKALKVSEQQKRRLADIAQSTNKADEAFKELERKGLMMKDERGLKLFTRPEKLKEKLRGGKPPVDYWSLENDEIAPFPTWEEVYDDKE